MKKKFKTSICAAKKIVFTYVQIIFNPFINCTNSSGLFKNFVIGFWLVKYLVICQVNQKQKYVKNSKKFSKKKGKNKTWRVFFYKSDFTWLASFHMGALLCKINLLRFLLSRRASFFSISDVWIWGGKIGKYINYFFKESLKCDSLLKIQITRLKEYCNFQLWNKWNSFTFVTIKSLI